MDGSSSDDIRITVTPKSQDVIPVRNQIIELDLTNTAVTVVQDTISVSSSGTSTTSTGASVSGAATTSAVSSY